MKTNESGKLKNFAISMFKDMQIDEKGRIVNKNGQLVTFEQTTASLKINQKREAEIKNRKSILKQKNYLKTHQRTNDLYQSIIPENEKRRIKKKNVAFSFIEKGTYEKAGEENRKKQITRALERQSFSGNISSFLSKTLRNNNEEPIPDTEWWDIPFLNENQFSFNPYDSRNNNNPNSANNPLDNIRNIDEQKMVFPKEFRIDEYLSVDMNLAKINDLIQHPIPIRNEYFDKLNSISVPIPLTDKEKKKLRKQKRKEKEKERREKIKYGIIPPPAPKIKMSNYMQVLTRQAVADPSKTEEEVKKMIKYRYLKHLARNKERMLTPRQRYEKDKKKANIESSEECKIALFRVGTLANPAHRYKISRNAWQNNLGGYCYYPDPQLKPSFPALVVAEGSKKGIKKFTRLMINRIKWTVVGEKHVTDDERKMLTEELKNNRCDLVWTGVIRKKDIDKFELKELRNINEASQILSDKQVSIYWEKIKNFQIPV